MNLLLFLIVYVAFLGISYLMVLFCQNLLVDKSSLVACQNLVEGCQGIKISNDYVGLLVIGVAFLNLYAFLQAFIYIYRYFTKLDENFIKVVLMVIGGLVIILNQAILDLGNISQYIFVKDLKSYSFLFSFVNYINYIIYPIFVVRFLLYNRNIDHNDSDDDHYEYANDEIEPIRYQDVVAKKIELPPREEESNDDNDKSLFGSNKEDEYMESDTEIDNYYF